VTEKADNTAEKTAVKLDQVKTVNGHISKRKIGRNRNSNNRNSRKFPIVQLGKWEET
jgi:hypothetical protein